MRFEPYRQVASCHCWASFPEVVSYVAMIYNLLYFWFYALTYTRGLPAISSPLLPFDDPLSDSISNLTSREVQPRDGKPFYLRIAPLGASITNGYLSSDGNGYRKHLRDQLRLAGWPVNMVGSIHSGSMNDDDNEGHLGWLISQVADSALPNIVPAQPNVVLINVGTNNANFTDDVSNAYNEYINVCYSRISYPLFYLEVISTEPYH